MKSVYLVIITWLGWDLEMCGSEVEVFDNKEKAAKRMNELAEEEIKEQAEFGRAFGESDRYEDRFVDLRDGSHRITIEVVNKKVEGDK